MSYSSKQKSWSPTRQNIFPRSVLQPTRILLVVVVLLLFFILHLSQSDAPARPRNAGAKGADVDALKVVKPQYAPGFRPLNGSKIAMVTFTTQEKSYTHLSLKNKYHYAKKHGYDLFVDYEQDNKRGLMWHKFEMVQQVVNTSNYDWVWWMDFDTLITNTNTKLESIIGEALANATEPEEIDWLFTPDCFELNAGSFIARTTPRIHTFVNTVIDYHSRTSNQDHQLSEQDCIRDVIFKEKQFPKSFKFLPQWKLNAFPKEIPCFDKDKRPFEHGFFTLHFAGAWAYLKEPDPTGVLMRKYEREIIW